MGYDIFHGIERKYLWHLEVTCSRSESITSTNNIQKESFFKYLKEILSGSDNVFSKYLPPQEQTKFFCVGGLSLMRWGGGGLIKIWGSLISFKAKFKKSDNSKAKKKILFVSCNSLKKIG